MRALALLMALFAIVVAGCGSSSGDEAAPTTPVATETMPPADATSRPPAPAIEGETLDGERLSLAELRGQPVFVNVWSSW